MAFTHSLSKYVTRNKSSVLYLSWILGAAWSGRKGQ